MFGRFLFGEVDSIDKLIVLIKTADFGKLVSKLSILYVYNR